MQHVSSTVPPVEQFPHDQAELSLLALAALLRAASTSAGGLAASPPFAAEATAAAAAAASAVSTAVASPGAAERGRGPPLHGVPCGRGIGRIGALRSRTRWPTRWAVSRSRSRFGTTRSAGEAGSSRVDAPRTSRPAAASTGAATCRGLLWPSRASRSKRVRLAGRPTHLPSTRSVRGGSSNARAMCDGRWCWRALGRSAPLVVAGTSLSRGRAPAYAS